MEAPSRPHPPDGSSGEHGGCMEACSGAGIPVVDLNALVNGAADQRSQAIRELGRACEDWGFFVVINHGVPEDLQAAVMDGCKELFSLPAEENAEYMEAGPMDPIRIGTGFYLLVDAAKFRRDYVKMFVHPEFYCPAKPAKMRGHCYGVFDLHEKSHAGAHHGDLRELGLDGGRISKALDLESCFQILVVNHYPPYAAPEDEVMGLPAHSDHGLLTLLFQNGVDGLQVEHNGGWLLAKPLPGSLFVIAGDQLEIVSNGRYKAALHRALVGGERTRMSFVSMIAPCFDAIVEPVPELARDCPHGLEFRGIKYRDYMEHPQSTSLNGKAALDFVRRQRDVSTCQGAPNGSSVH